MKFENTEVWGFEHALRGMRNPKESWEKSDSSKIYWDGNLFTTDETRQAYFANFGVNYNIGENDMKLAQSLIRAGSEHRKFLRQLFVSVDITAPLYWWKEFDTYKIGTVANSTSTMHKIQSKPITLDCFEIDDINLDLNVDGFMGYSSFNIEQLSNAFVDALEYLRRMHIRYTTNAKRENITEAERRHFQKVAKKYWKELIRWLPESWLQTRTVTMNYENLLGMCSKGQRRFHKLNEWSGIDNPILFNFISWARTLPYAKEFIFIDEQEE